MYVRFVVAGAKENPWQAGGVISSTRILLDQGRFDPHEIAVVEAAFDWFNERLPCPPFRKRLARGTWSPDAVAWFLANARSPIGRMRDLVAVLKEHNVPVRMFRANDPGDIVYRDEFQVVAETPRAWPRDRSARRTASKPA